MAQRALAVLGGELPQRCAAAGVTLRVPRPGLCTDNGAMIAAVGDQLVRADRTPSPLDFSARPSVELRLSLLT